MSRLRLAVVGVGHLGRIHARLAAGVPEIELVAVVDRAARGVRGRGRGDRRPAGRRVSRADRRDRRRGRRDADVYAPSTSPAS